MPESLHLSGHAAYKTAIENKMLSIYNSLIDKNNQAYDALMDFCTAIKNEINAHPNLTSGDFVNFINNL